MSEPWPSTTPRDQLLTRVALTGAHRVRLRRFALLAGAGALVVSAAVGFGAGRSGGVDLVGDPASVASTPDHTAPYSACPTSPPIGELHQDDRVYLTGRTEDSTWLELRAPSDPAGRVWVEAAVVDADEGISDLQVHDCDLAGQQLAAPGQTTTTVTSTTLPGETTTTTSPDESTTTSTGATTSTTTTKPTTTTTTTKPTTTTTAPPDTTKPSISGLAADINEIFTSDANCGVQPKSTPVQAVVSDSSGLQSVTLGWSFTTNHGGQQTGSKPMTLSGGKYRATFGPFPNTMNTATSVVVTWTVTAVDKAPGHNSRTVSVLKDERITVSGPCFG